MIQHPQSPASFTQGSGYGFRLQHEKDHFATLAVDAVLRLGGKLGEPSDTGRPMVDPALGEFMDVYYGYYAFICIILSLCLYIQFYPIILICILICCMGLY